jgi:PIN domain nuclease of toxin-antitoxin system
MLLLDTNIWFKSYWRLPLSPDLSAFLESDDLALSPVSALEIATKIRKGHFPGIPPIEKWLNEAVTGYFVAPVTAEIAASAGADEWDHQDPGDRLIVHTALKHGFTLVHSDAAIKQRSDLRQAYFKMPI